MTSMIIIIFYPLISSGQTTIEGKWKTIDDNTGKQRSIVEIFKKGDAYFGKIIWLKRDPGEDPNPLCDDCEQDDDRYMQPVVGMEIIRNMKADGEEFEGGTVLDPENGSIYKCKIWLEEGDLKLRGYIAFFYRTQTWLKFEGEMP
ncbi:MAG: DUF2147 domain-containing protein [Reichenbachiella sp.]